MPVPGGFGFMPATAIGGEPEAVNVILAVTCKVHRGGWMVMSRALDDGAGPKVSGSVATSSSAGIWSSISRALCTARYRPFPCHSAWTAPRAFPGRVCASAYGRYRILALQGRRDRPRRVRVRHVSSIRPGQGLAASLLRDAEEQPSEPSLGYVLISGMPEYAG
jgi:hypothetical protein